MRCPQDHAASGASPPGVPAVLAAHDHPQPASIAPEAELEKLSEVLDRYSAGLGCALRALLPGCFRERCRQLFARDQPEVLDANRACQRNDRCRVHPTSGRPSRFDWPSRGGDERFRCGAALTEMACEIVTGAAALPVRHARARARGQYSGSAVQAHLKLTSASTTV
jgi:hypothetical protein